MAIESLKNSSEFDKIIESGVTLVDFYADWCGPCKMIAPILQQVADEVSDVKILKVDVDQFNDLQAKFEVMSIPTLIVFKDGEVIDQKLGFVAKEQIVALIDSAR